ncbi:MAG: ferredoxin [Thermoproteota archaeon]|nr:MAG: ferredoxin [Candidatus Korarchaeota archaeon]
MRRSGRVRVTFEPQGKKVLVERGVTLLEAVVRAGLRIRSECGGFGKCGKCRVLVRNPRALGEVTESEKSLLSRDELEEGMRLACQARLLGDAEVYLPPESRIEGRKILEAGLGREVKLEPVVRKVHLLVPEPTHEDVRADYDRLLESLLGVLRASGIDLREPKVDQEFLKDLPKALRRAKWDVTVVVRDEEILCLEEGNTERENYGLAIDIGTSKIVIYLVDVEEGEVLGVRSVENPQLMFGEDIMSRLTFAMESEENRLLLQKILVEEINKEIRAISGGRGVNRDRIYEAVVVGNTAMHHLFLGIETRYLAISPYVPAVRGPVEARAKSLGLEINERGYVFTLPVVAGFVGADGVADLLATGIHVSDDVSLLLDIGTNTEVFLGNRDRILACSAASGPAFEGGHIKFGMKASSGAIERVSIDPKTLEVSYRTVDGGRPIGLCGSAVIDVVAEMLRCGLIDRHGRMREEIGSPRMRRKEGELEFVLAWRQEAGLDEDITITQKDIRELQLAKAAIYAAQQILMRRMGVSPGDISRVLVAGAFGSGINVENAVMIGLFPEEHRRKVQFVGNTAIVGAKMALVSRKAREEAMDLLTMIEYVELSLDPSFEEEFIGATELPHRDLERFPSVKEFLEKG